MHRIYLLYDDIRPVHSAPYWAGSTVTEYSAAEIGNMIIQKVIEPATIEWEISIVLTAKKDGSLHFCDEYRELNALMIHDSNPLPCMGEYIDRLREGTIFPTLNAKLKYWKIEIDVHDLHKTTLTSHHELYKFTEMSFMLNNPNRKLSKSKGCDSCLCALTVLYGVTGRHSHLLKSPRDHIERVQRVLEVLYKAVVTIKLKKSKIFDEYTGYFGHVTRSGRLDIAKQTAYTVTVLEEPTTRTELRSFLGFCNVARRFVSNIAWLTAPLNWKIKKDQPKESVALD